MTREAIMIEFALRHVAHGGGYSADAADWSINAMADEIIRLRHALREANRPPEDAEHHPYHWGEMADMAIDAAVRIAQSDTSRCLSCGAWV